MTTKIMHRCLLILSCLTVLATTPLLAAETLMMATTTSTDNTGLLDYLAPRFTKDTGIPLKWTATGTGKALKLGENCDVDVLLVHAPNAEYEYMKKGYGLDRREIMYNDFVIIGPASDPAKVMGRQVDVALNRIREKKMIFVSRGDNSGTHKKERALWKHAGNALPEKQSWYVQSGQGMLATIGIAAERNGYTLTDRGTYIKYEDTQKGKPPLTIMVEGDASLKNQYSVLAVNPKRCPKVKYELAKQFSDWMAGESAQKLIGDFTLLGKQLFKPNAKP